MNTGIVFPGMGPSSYSNLGKFMATDPCARRLRRTADAVLGYSLMDLYRASEVDYSEYCQVAFLISCIALIEQAADMLDAEPVACAGPSFGGKTALAYSGALPFSETVLLVARLARCEEEYFRAEFQDVVTQSVARMPEPVLREILAAMTARGEWQDISCHIDHDFFMVSMRESSLKRFSAQARAAGGLPLYAMRPPMHSSAFAALVRKAEEEVLSDFSFSDPRVPIISDHDGSVITTAAGARKLVLDSFIRPVRWQQTVQSMKNMGVEKLYISGPDSLFGRVNCTKQNFTVVPISSQTMLRNYAMKHAV
jgi:[acyl-carrier-protein] S-malonyltransferase